MSSPASLRRTLLLIVMALAGFCTLAFEVVAMRILRLILGSATTAVAGALATFMAGMGLGNLLGGRQADRTARPLETAAIWQLVAAWLFLSLPLLLHGAPLLEGWLPARHGIASFLANFASPLLSLLLLTAACVGLGALLPLVSGVFIRGQQSGGRDVGLLYGFNAFGSAVGAFCTGFLLLPALGLLTTVRVISGVAGIVALLLLITGLGASLPVKTVFSLDSLAPSGRNRLASERIRFVITITLLSYGVAGGATMLYEMGWTRLVGSILGSSVYAFSLMLTAIVAGLALGGWLGGIVADRMTLPIHGLGLVEYLLGIGSLSVLPILNWTGGFFPPLLARYATFFWRLHAVELALLFAILMLPSVLMGMAFPLAVRAVPISDRGTGGTVGLTAGINTIGAVAGVIAGTLILLPRIGVRPTLLIGSGLNVLAGVTLTVAAQTNRRPTMLWPVPLMFAAWVPAAWLAMRSAGQPGQFSPLVSAINPTYAGVESRTLYHRDGALSSVTVRETARGERVVLLDGKPDASSVGDLPTQILAAHLPLVFHPKPRQVLVIGLASGITLGSASRHELETLDCAEIEPAMLEACRHFDAFNYRVLSDPRVRLIIADGRHHLATTSDRYDVVISEPTNPWIAGMGDLFTREFFQLCLSRLRPGGLVCVWLEAYTLDAHQFASVVRSFSSVFPWTTLWNPKPFDYLLLGSAVPVSISSSALAARLTKPGVCEDLARIGVRSPADFLACFVLDVESVRILASGASFHTDDNALLEFHAPRSMFRRDAAFGILERIETLRVPDFSFIRVSDDDGENLLRTAVAFTLARGHVLKALLLAHQGRNTEGEKELMRAAALNPADSFLNRALREKLIKAAAALRRGDMAGAELLYKQILVVLPQHAEANYGLGYIAERQGKSREAMAWYEQALQSQPTNVVYHLALAGIKQRQGLPTEAIAHYRTALAICPDSAPIHNNLAWLLATAEPVESRNTEEAIRLARMACDLTDWQDVRMILTLADIHVLNGRRDEALRVLGEALTLSEKRGNRLLSAKLTEQLQKYRSPREESTSKDLRADAP